MLTASLLVLIVVAVAQAGRQPHVRTLTKPEVPAKVASAVSPFAGWRASGSVSVTYRHLTARQWAMRYKRRTRQYQQARYALLARSSVTEAINLACAIYGHCPTLWRKARCETGGTFSPNAKNPTSTASGLFQFLTSTWATTPFGSFSIFSPYASALAAGWMHSVGRGGEWQCR